MSHTKNLFSNISSVCENVKKRPIDLLAMAHDASHYLLTPKVVAVPKNAAEVAAIMNKASATGSHITFRSGGTSLSGQAGSDEILIDTRNQFKKIKVLADGLKVIVEPGATLVSVNARLLRHKRVLGPDPASVVACTIGGVIANNSSGMTCGIHANSYRTIDSLKIILPSGTYLDTSEVDSDNKLKELEPEIYSGLISLRDRIRSNPDSMARIKKLYSIKNTIGYGLNSFVDFDRPIDILEHLIIGSEGTLAFVAEATFNTLPLNTHFSTGLLIFKDFDSACKAIPTLISAEFGTIEMLDSAALRVAQADPVAPPELKNMNITNEAALLVEIRQTDLEKVTLLAAAAQKIIDQMPLAQPAKLGSDRDVRESLWHIRRGLYALVASARPDGTTALLEDIAVPIENLAFTCAQLIKLFEIHKYEGAVIFGHAKDGNIHFLLNERFDRPENVARYKQFTEEMVDLVLSQSGTLKAEHGTGRIMAPFVPRQYGDELYDVMKEVKRLIDPKNLLNPGVLISNSPTEHLENLKNPFTVEPEINKCVECGYCEAVCPSKDLTLTPRQRIVIRREIKRAESENNKQLAKELISDYNYAGIETCAVDGMCESHCPVQINTGDLVRNLRAEQASNVSQLSWRLLASHWNLATKLISFGLSISKKMPNAIPVLVTKSLRKIIGDEKVPQYFANLPIGGASRKQISDQNPDVIYFPSCTNAIFGPAEGEIGITDSVIKLFARANLKLATPKNIGNLCCGTPWKSKGMNRGYEVMKKQVTDSIRQATRNGQIPIICDASSCTEGLQILLSAAKENGIQVFDAMEYVEENLLAKLNISKKIESVTLHKTCATTRTNANNAMKKIATEISEKVFEPADWGCCAFAGDRGLLHPELTESATKLEAKEILESRTQTYVSSNRTCEIGMSQATNQKFQHLLELVEMVSRVE